MQAVAMMQQQTSSGRYRAPASFRMYLMEGEHWRTGKRLRGEEAQREYQGLQLHRQGSGTDGQSGPRQFTTAFMEQLEQGVHESRIERGLPAARWRYGRVQDALQALRDDAREHSDALAYYMLPQARRCSVTKQADALRVDASTLRRHALEACDLMWEELGGVW